MKIHQILVKIGIKKMKLKRLTNLFFTLEQFSISHYRIPKILQSNCVQTEEKVDPDVKEQNLF